MLHSVTSPLPGVHVAVGSPLAVNAVIFSDGDEAVIVDATGTVAQGRELALLATHGLKARLSGLVNTHGHSDHSTGNAGVLAVADAPLIAHRRWWETRRRERGMIARRPAPRLEPGLRHPDVPLEGDSEIRCGARRLELLHAPGHSPDLLMVHEPETGTLVASDNLLAGSDPDQRAIPYFYWGAPGPLREALRRAVALRPRRLIPGHGALLEGPRAATALESAMAYLDWLLDALPRLPTDVTAPDEDEAPADWAAALPLESFIRRPAPDWVQRMHELNLLRLFKSQP